MLPDAPEMINVTQPKASFVSMVFVDVKTGINFGTLKRLIVVNMVYLSDTNR
jgi:hypothetical protein